MSQFKGAGGAAPGGAAGTPDFAAILEGFKNKGGAAGEFLKDYVCPLIRLILIPHQVLLAQVLASPVALPEASSPLVALDHHHLLACQREQARPRWAVVDTATEAASAISNPLRMPMPLNLLMLPKMQTSRDPRVKAKAKAGARAEEKEREGAKEKVERRAKERVSN
jgi:hypothetical protein